MIPAILRNGYEILTGSANVPGMRQVVFTRFGGPEVLEVVDAAEPHAAAGQVRVAVGAAGVNPADWRLREGSYRADTVRFPSGVGLDAAGVVDEVGAGVDGVAVGDPVFGRGFGTYAEHAVLISWARIPTDMDFPEAAGYPSVVETALRALRDVDARSGETVLVSGAAGGVGSAVLQIAGDRGIAVVGIAGPANQDYVRELGARATTYGDGWVERVRQLGPVDAALDLAGSGVLPDLVGLVGDPARVVTIADLTAPDHGVRFSGGGGDVTQALREAVDLISRGQLTIPVDTAYPLADAASAHRDSHAGHTRGRRVITL